MARRKQGRTGRSQTGSPVRDVVEAAVVWRLRSGWPGREADLALAARWLVTARGPRGVAADDGHWQSAYARGLHAALVRRHGGATAGHRLVLCLVLARMLIPVRRPRGPT